MRIRLDPPGLSISALTSILVALLLAVGLAVPTVAQSEMKDEDAARTKDVDITRKRGLNGARVLAVHHGPVTVTLADETSDGHQLGDLRVTSIPTADAKGTPLGQLDATLTTTAVDTPAIGDEIRIGSLVFSFGEEGTDEVVVNGSALYPAQGSTIATGATTTRPIVGGSGRFSGASGSAVTQHLDDGHWVHWLKFDRNQSGLEVALERAFKQRVKAGIRDFKDERKVRRDDRKADRAGRREARKAERSAASSEETGITRTDLGIAEPGSAPGQELGLWHYSIPAGSELAPHTHPGWQIARIASGELEYTVISGEGMLIAEDGSSETIGPGTYTLKTGDSVVENPELEHFGANRTRRPVTIVAATLYPAGVPLSTALNSDPDVPAAAEEPDASPAA